MPFETLSKRHHLLAQLLLFKGCVAEKDIVSAISHPDEEQQADIDIERVVNQINVWHENAMTGLQIDSCHWIDSVTYYGFVQLTNDEISKQSMTSLSTKQLKFWKILLNISLANAGTLSFDAAVSLNQSGLLGIQNILSRTELQSLIKTLEKGKYLESISDAELDAQRVVAAEENPFFVLGPRSFIDLKNWIEQKSDYSQFECPLCSDYVLFKGFRCGHQQCPSTLHRQCIETYFESVTNRNFKCPSCQNAVEMQDMDGLGQFVQALCNPNDSVSIVKNLKGRASKFEPVEQLSNRNEPDSDEDSFED